MNILPLGQTGILQRELYIFQMHKAEVGLTLFSQRVTGRHAVSFGGHAGEGAQILQGGVVEDGPGPAHPRAGFGLRRMCLSKTGKCVFVQGTLTCRVH